jgi:epoxyqueuosine reductase
VRSNETVGRATRTKRAETHVGPVARRGLTAAVEDIAHEAGVDIVGFGDIREALPADFHHLTVGVSLGVVHPALRSLHLLPGRPPAIDLERALYDHRDGLARVLLETTLRRLAAYLQAQGFRYFSCPPEVDPMDSPFTALLVRRFSHKAAATCAGLGSVGRHGLLNHPRFGPHVTWATLVTNAPLDTGTPCVESTCGDCSLCVSACPAGAISGREWRRADGMVSLVDADKCRQMLADNERATGRRFCGRCAVACAGAHVAVRGRVSAESDERRWRAAG